MRARKLGLALAASCLALVATEGALRYALFSRDAFARDRFWELRKPERYYDSRSEDAYWLLKRALHPPARDPTPEELHPKLGWIDDSLDRATLLPRDARGTDGRQRVVLVGDSFARCMPEALPCFESLLESSPLRARFTLVNQGVRGYGLDQAALMLEGVLPALAGERPLVVIAIFVDEDLDRCRLSVREAPKPRFVRRGTSWDLEHATLPSCAEFFARNAPPTTSYLWRLVARRVDDDPHADEIAAVARGVLDRVRATCDAARVERFFVLMHGERSVYEPDPADWRETFLVGYLREHGERWVSTRAPFAAARAEGLASDPFLRAGPSTGHYSAAGNELAFRALAAGLEGRFER